MTIRELIAMQHGLLARISQSYKDGTYLSAKAAVERGLIPNDKIMNEGELAETWVKTAETKDIILAMTDELHELLRELNWKPWKKTKVAVNRERVAREIADCWHFLLNLTILWNLDDDIERLMQESYDKCHERADRGY